MSSLKQKTLSGFFWNLIETGSAQLMSLISTMVLARLLIPADFGLIGMTTLFVALGQVLVDSGFSQALIRKQDCTNKDYSTILWLNIGISWLLYLLIFLCAPLVALYFDEPRLILILRIITLVLPLNAMIVIQRTILSKQLNFKHQAIVTLTSVVSGLIGAIIMASFGMGVWALVGKAVITQLVMALGFWLSTSWRPQFIFSWESCRELFTFGSKLLLVYSLATISKNVFNIIIGKKYQATELGYYTNADLMASMPTSILTILFNRVVFPALSPLQDDNDALRRVIREILRPLLLICFSMMFFFVATADSLVIIFLGEQWLPIIPYFQILCIGYSAALLHTVNQVILNIKGRSDLFLRTEIMKYTLMVPIIIIGIYYGIYALIISYAIFFWFGFILNGWYSFKLIGYGIWGQVKDAFPILLYAICIAGIAMLVGFILPDFHPLLRLTLQFLAIIPAAIFAGRISGLAAYRQLIELVKEQYVQFRHKI